MQPRFHARGDAGQVGELQRIENMRQIFLSDQRQAVRLLHVGRDLGQEPRRCDPDGRIQTLADFLLDARFHVECDLACVRGFAFVADQLAGELVD
jgi:hypothetical protein